MKAWTVSVSIIGLMALAVPARADILSLTAQIQGGGAGGSGMGGAQKDNAFHDGARGGSYGALVGGELMLVDGWIEHNQFISADGLVGTWTQFMLGLDVNFGLGDRPVLLDEQGKPNGRGMQKGYAELGLAIGFGVGTGQQVMLPLDNSEVTDKGFLGQVSVAVGYRLTKALSLGLRVPVQYGYMFKNGIANDEANHYQSIQASAMLNLRVDFQLK